MKRILLIEDDTAMAGTIKNYLKLKNFEVFHAENGALGIQSAFSISPDAIVCDIDIPVVDGYEVFKILNETAATQLIPFIFLTGKASLSDIRTGMKMGVDDYLTKPFDIEDLYGAITTRINKRERTAKSDEDKFNRLLNTSPHGIFICQHNRFVVTNQKMANIFGYSQMDMQDKSMVDLTDNKDKERVNKSILDCLNNKKKEFDIEFTGKTKHQKPVPLKLIASYSFYKGLDCIVGNLINLSSNNYTLHDIALSNSELDELGKAIDLFSENYNIISRDLVKKLSGIFENEDEKHRYDIETVVLSSREEEVLNKICLGKSTGEIAKELFISERTVEKHRASIIAKTQSKNMIEAVIYAIKHKLIKV